MKPGPWLRYRRQLDEWTIQTDIGLLSAVKSLQQVVSRKGDKVSPTQYQSQLVDDKQERRAPLYKELQYSTRLDYVRVQEQKHQDGSRRNLQMAHCKAVCDYNSRTDSQNSPSLLPNVTAKSYQFEQPTWKGWRSPRRGTSSAIGHTGARCNQSISIQQKTRGSLQYRKHL